jgi:hypothetical protein
MQTAVEYLDRTASAVRKLFEGIDSYLAVLTRAVPPVFVGSGANRAQADAEFEAWKARHDLEIRAALQAQRDYFAESFALATLCGSVLQVAAKGIETFSKNDAVPPDWSGLVKSKHKAARYCIGKPVRGVPLGLVLLAGRNQHMHFGEEPLHEPNVEVFKRLATYHTIQDDPDYRDPAFDLENKNLTSFAHNITALIGWRGYESYEHDMRELLAV